MHANLFKRLENIICSIAPFIDRLVLEPRRLAPNEIELRWKEVGDHNSTFSAYQLSDGTLRFIALATVLMQPHPPSVVVIDEPELGLHPSAIILLSELIKMASEQSQIIVSSQSVSLVNCFEPEHIVTVNRNFEGNDTVFSRLNHEELKSWLENYTLGELWERNIFNSGQPFAK